MIKTKIINPTIGKNLKKVLGDTLVKDYYAAISEFVCNSYDADAENVHIDFNSAQETLTIMDDGSGMDEESFEHFFRLGDSQKIEEPISPIKRRKRVGKKGLAKTLLGYLGDSFSIESVCNGNRYLIDEGIVDGNVSGIALLEHNGMTDGTKITVKNLKFNIGKRGFDLEKLNRRLQWDVPNRPDFDVYIGNKLIKKRGVVEYASVYEIDKEIGSGKQLTGRLYLQRSKKAVDLEGVRIYVNGRSVGDNTLFDLKSIDSRFVGRVQGEVNADFLERFITLDRSSFQDNPDLDLTINYVNTVLYSMSFDLDKGSTRRAYYLNDKLFKIVENALLEAQEQLNSKLETDYELELANCDKAGPIARLQEGTNTISVNAGNNLFTFVSKKCPSRNKLSEIYLKRAFLIASAHAIAKDSNNLDERISELVVDQSSKAFVDYDGIRSVVGKFLEGKLLTSLDEMYLNQYRLYDHMEVSTMTGRPSNIIRLIHNSGALPGSEEHLFSKDDLLDTFKSLEDYLSCIEVVDPSYGQVNIKIGGHIEIRYDIPKATSLDETLVDLSLIEFGIINVGLIHPLHFVPKTQSEKFSRYVQNNGLYTPK